MSDEPEVGRQKPQLHILGLQGAAFVGLCAGQGGIQHRIDAIIQRRIASEEVIMPLLLT